jgi:hypothetical protein
VTTIGLLNENSLHSALKRWYARPGDLVEVSLDGYIVDILRGDHDPDWKFLLYQTQNA